MTTNDTYYESEKAVDYFSRFHDMKEILFCKAVVDAIGAAELVLELGAGTGFHGEIIREMLSFSEYLHTDKSEAMVAAATARGLPSRTMDALNIEIGAACAILAIGLSTILSLDPEMRNAQFREMVRVLPPDGTLVLTSPAWQWQTKTMHCLDRSDVEYLKGLGLSEWKWFRCSVVPGAAWRALPAWLCQFAEDCFGWLGWRRVLAMHVPQDQARP